MSVIMGLYGAAGWHPSAEHRWIHSAGAALVVDGVLQSAISEERLTRSKYAGVFPDLSIEAVLEVAGIEDDEIDGVVMATSTHHRLDDTRKVLNKRFQDCEIEIVDHHRAHALLVYHSCPDEDATVFTVDGAGSVFPDGSYENATLSVGRSGDLRCLMHSILRQAGEPTFLLGQVYNAVSQAAFMAKVPDAVITNVYELMEVAPGKMMGLAAYGNPMGVKDVNLFQVEDGGFYFPKIVPGTPLNPMELLKSGVTAEDLMAFLQTSFENILVEWLEQLPEIARSPTLCLGGGCALNILANRRVLDVSWVENVWAHPASNDTGLPIGAALHMALGQPEDIDRDSFRNPYTGPEYSEEAFSESLSECVGPQLTED